MTVFLLDLSNDKINYWTNLLIMPAFVQKYIELKGRENNAPACSICHQLL
jgi:hypothetical protein